MEVPEDGAGVCERQDPSPHTAGCSWHYLWSFRLCVCVCEFFFSLNNTFHYFELDLSCLPTLGRNWEMTFPCPHPWEGGCWHSKVSLLGQMSIEVWFLSLRLPEPPPRPGWGPDSNVALHPQGSCCRCPHPACRLCPPADWVAVPSWCDSEHEGAQVQPFPPMTAYLECRCARLAPGFPWLPLVPSAARQPYPAVHPHLAALLSSPHAAILRWVPWLSLCAVPLMLPALFQLGLNLHPPCLLRVEFLLLFPLFYRPSADIVSIFPSCPLCRWSEAASALIVRGKAGCAGREAWWVT